MKSIKMYYIIVQLFNFLDIFLWFRFNNSTLKSFCYEKCL